MNRRRRSEAATAVSDQGSAEGPATGVVIELHVREASQLFDALDPSPFREKDLDRNAEEYIVDSVRELSVQSLSALVIYLDRPSRLADEERAVQDAIHVHFTRLAKLRRRDLQRLLRRGVISLAIGSAFLGTFFALAQLLGHWMGERPFTTLLREGLMIVGWVAMWRPLEIFLYDWWPILGEQRLHERLSRIPVRVVYSESRESPRVDGPAGRSPEGE
jgi:hypothetical protein